MLSLGEFLHTIGRSCCFESVMGQHIIAGAPSGGRHPSSPVAGGGSEEKDRDVEVAQLVSRYCSKGPRTSHSTILKTKPLTHRSGVGGNLCKIDGQSQVASTMENTLPSSGAQSHEQGEGTTYDV